MVYPGNRKFLPRVSEYRKRTSGFPFASEEHEAQNNGFSKNIYWED